MECYRCKNPVISKKGLVIGSIWAWMGESYLNMIKPYHKNCFAEEKNSGKYSISNFLSTADISKLSKIKKINYTFVVLLVVFGFISLLQIFSAKIPLSWKLYGALIPIIILGGFSYFPISNIRIIKGMEQLN